MASQGTVASQATILTLPLDLQMLIMDHLTWIEYVAFALAGYCNLQYRHADRFPAMNQHRLRMIHEVPSNITTDPLAGLPTEMIALIACRVDRRTLMSWVFAHYPTLVSRGLVPRLTLANAGQLHLAWLRRAS